MAANIETGRERTVRYCGGVYIVRRGKVYGRKQTWEVWYGDLQLTSQTPTRSRAVWVIHRHAAELGSFPTAQQDGITYDQLVGQLCR